jgi:hypothetical protein
MSTLARTASFLFAACIVAALSVASPAAEEAAVKAGDTHPPIDCRYPPRVFLHEGQGGHALDVTKPPFNARGDGRTDDTRAFIRAYDYVLTQMDESPWGGGGPAQNDDYVIYVPAGTYLLSDTVVYSSPPRIGRTPDKPNKWEQVARIRFIGQSRNGTVLRLRDGCPGFGPGTEKPVVSFGKTAFNNHKAFHAFRNLTVDTGRGNPGAVGLDFQGANLAEIHNVTIRSGDGRGAAGLLMRIAPTVGCHRNITVEGFEYGIRMALRARATHACFEHVTLRGQGKAGIRLEDGASMSIRDLLSVGAVPAIQVADASAHAVVLDSRLTADRTDAPAVDLAAGQLLARNVRVSGFATAVRDGPAGTRTGGPTVEEYVSGKVLVPSADAPGKTVGLPIRDVPRVPWDPNLSRWACPEDFGARADGRADDTAAVQAAMDAGKPTVYFPSRRYRTEGEIRVPRTVRRINGLFHGVHMAFAVGGNADDGPLVVEDLSHGTVLLDGTRPVVVNLADWVRCRNRCQADGGALFLNGVHGPDAKTNTGSVGRLAVWARSINSEGRSLPIVADNVDLWVMGFKTERGAVQFDVRGGSRLEVLGGTFGVACSGPYVRNASGRVSLAANTSGFGVRGDEAVLAESGGDGQILVRQCPERPGKVRNVFIPWLVSEVRAEECDVARSRPVRSAAVGVQAADGLMVPNRTLAVGGRRRRGFNRRSHPGLRPGPR